MPTVNPARSVFAPCLLVAFALTTTPSCYHYRVTAFRADDGVIAHAETNHQWFWGLIASPILLSPTSEDPSRRTNSNSLYEVRVSTNLGFALATVLTLGIWAPARVEWISATVPATQGELPIPGASGTEARGGH